jgi:predicted dehydrogenase
MPSQKPLEVGVVGCGYWGPNLIRNFNGLDDANVKLVCDTDEARLAHMKRRHPSVDTRTSADDLFSDPELDAVVIATPVHLHYPLACKSLEAGKHTFIEKPMARSVKECEALVGLADQGGLTLMVGHTFVYTAVVRRIKEILDSGEIGDVLYISSRRLNLGLFQKDINVAWDLAPHDISIILYLLGRAPETVNCQGKAHVAEGIEDVTNMSLTFADGRFATIHSSWLDPNKVREMTIVGTQKMIVYDDIEPQEKIKIYDKRVEVPPHYDTFAEFQYSYHYGDIHSPYLNQVEPLKVECQHFVDCIRTGDTPLSSGVEGLRVIEVLEAACESLEQNGGSVRVRSGA